MIMASILAIVNLIIGIVIGKFHERWEWNKLIEAGKIKPPYRA